MKPLNALLLVAPVVLILGAKAVEELSLLAERAEKADPIAQIEVTPRYRDGKGVERNHPLAMQWAHRAADAGHAAGMDYADGLGHGDARCSTS